MLTLYTGPMGCDPGKTESVIRAAQSAAALGRRVLGVVLVGSLWSGSEATIVSRTGLTWPAVPVREMEEAKALVRRVRPDVLLLPELHRYSYAWGPATITHFVLAWEGYGIDVVGDALDYDLWGEPLHPWAQLRDLVTLGWPDVTIHQLTGLCMDAKHGPECGSERSWLRKAIGRHETPPVGDLARVEAGAWVGGLYVGLCLDGFETRLVKRLNGTEGTEE